MFWQALREDDAKLIEGDCLESSRGQA